MSKESDYDRLRDIWESRTRAGSKHSSRHQQEVDAQINLRDLAFALHRDNYDLAAEAIASFLLGKTNSLDEAFGLTKSGRGRPPSKETLDRDAKVLQACLGGMSYSEIASQTGMIKFDVEKFCKGASKAFALRRDAAYAELLRKNLEQQG